MAEISCTVLNGSFNVLSNLVPAYTVVSAMERLDLNVYMYYMYVDGLPICVAVIIANGAAQAFPTLTIIQQEDPSDRVRRESS